MPISLRTLLIASYICRLALTAWGEIQDRLLDVKFTDIDYVVFTDAARFVYNGLSPFTRSTYRYSPLLSYLLLPNIFLHGSWGKVLFSTLDIIAALIMVALARKRGVSPARVTCMVAAWLLNPFTATISTRGSCDVMVVVMLLLVIWCLETDRLLLAAVVYGLSVHFRVYPIIYAPSILLWLLTSQDSRKHVATLASRFHSAFTFGVVSASTFIALGWYFFHLYGHQFLHEAYLYHSSRRDPRHNFSIYFYDCYLRHFGSSSSQFSSPDPGQWAVVPQLCCLLLTALFFSHSLPLCWSLQTIAFVALNKVSTAQYFVWYFGLLPLALVKMPWPLPRDLVCALGVWLVAQLHWLAWAYLLEFQGLPVYLGVWGAGVLFLLSHVGLMVMVMKYGDQGGAVLDKQKRA